MRIYRSLVICWGSIHISTCISLWDILGALITLKCLGCPFSALSHSSWISCIFLGLEHICGIGGRDSALSHSSWISCIFLGLEHICGIVGRVSNRIINQRSVLLGGEIGVKIKHFFKADDYLSKVGSFFSFRGQHMFKKRIVFRTVVKSNIMQCLVETLFAYFMLLKIVNKLYRT